MSASKNPVIDYIRGVKSEMSKVVWPTQKTLINHTILTITISLVIAAFLGGLDYIFAFGLEQFFKLK